MSKYEQQELKGLNNVNVWVITCTNRSSHWKMLWKINVLWILNNKQQLKIQLKSLKNKCEEVHF